jgi:hypothetical protein
MLHEQKLGRGPKQKMLEKALQQYRGMFLLHDAKSLCAVAAGNNHHLARAEDVQVSVVEVYAAAAN